MIRATLVRALVLSAAFAGPLTPVQCLGQDGHQLPAKATQGLSPELLSLLRKNNIPKQSPILVRVFKEESELEVWMSIGVGSGPQIGIQKGPPRFAFRTISARAVGAGRDCGDGASAW